VALAMSDTITSTIDRNARPTEAQRIALGASIAARLRVTAEDFPNVEAVTDEQSLAAFITTQASNRTWATILAATPEQIMRSGVPGPIFDNAAPRHGIDEAGQSILDAATDLIADIEKGVHPYGALAHVTEDRPFSARLSKGDLVRVFTASTDGDGTYYRVSGTGNLLDQEWTVHHRHLVLVGDPIEEAISEIVLDQPEVRALRAENESLTRRLRASEASLQQAHLDIEAASEVFNRAANREGMCSVYDRVVNEANEAMSVLSFTAREQDYTVTVAAELTLDICDGQFTGAITVEVGVRATDADDAQESVDDDMVRRAVYDALPSSVDRDFQVDEWECRRAEIA
jgi:hypothetical protein